MIVLEDVTNSRVIEPPGEEPRRASRALRCSRRDPVADKRSCATRTAVASCRATVRACGLAGVLAAWLTAGSVGAGVVDRVVRGPAAAEQTVIVGAGLREQLPLAATAEASPARTVPGLLVVKYRPTIDDCVHCLLENGRSLAGVGATASLDRLNTDLGVRAARPLFFNRHSLSTRQATAAFRASVAAAADRFPLARRARMRLDAVPDLTHVYELEISEEIDVHAAAARYAADPDVVYAHPVHELWAHFTPNDPYFGTSGSWGQSYQDLWGLHAIDAGTAWDVAQGEGAVIAIVDTGVDRTSPDIAANLWTNPGEVAANGVDDDGNGYVDDVYGWDFHYGDADPTDRHGHGTHVAGTAAAVGNNGLGILGAAFRARIMAVQGLNDEGDGLDSRLAQAIVYAAENGADVINNSWGGFGLAESIYDAIETANALGAVVSSSAGNDGRSIGGLLWLPAGHPKGLTVGASAPDGTLASFSNYGPQQSIVAPGEDVLSLLSQNNVWDPSLVVGGQYVRLSGTSMSAPHASGAAALLISAEPSLTPDEVRWHLELNADQPGYAGYEGQLHNPIYGYGRLNAASVFNTPPVTTRLTPPVIRKWHSFPNRRSQPGLPGSFYFTTFDPVAWSITTPAWLAPGAPSGAGPSSLPLEIDAVGLSPGTYPGDLHLVAPEAIDGGSSFSATLHVHRDERLGSNIVLGQDGYGTNGGFAPDSASNPLRTVVAWRGWKDTYGLQLASFDGGATVSGPTRVVEAGPHNITLGSDGHDFLLAWLQYAGDYDEIRMARVRADGQLIDTEPLLLVSKRSSFCRSLDLAGVGHDGGSYVVLTTESNWCGGKMRLYGWRVYPDGSMGKGRRLFNMGEIVPPVFACRPGTCLLVWMRSAPEATEPATGKYVRGGYALPVNVDARRKALPKKIVTDTYYFTDLATNGTDFLAVSQRYFFCARGDLCRTEVIGTRVSADGSPLDTDAIVISNAPPDDRVYPWPQSAVHDGTQWVVSYGVSAVADSPFENGSYLFVNRVDDGGVPLETEYIGMLVDAEGRASESRLSATATETVLLWEDGRFDPIEGIYGHPIFSAHMAQRLFPRDVGSEFPEQAIGTIGALSVGEGETLRLRATAPGHDPQTTTFVVTGLPESAVLDATTGLFQWRPGGTQAGSYVATLSALSNGTPVVSEEVSISVTERVSSVSGLVRLSDGTPVASAALKIKGTPDKQRTAYTDSTGRYRVEGFVPGANVRVGLTRPSSRQYQGGAVRLAVGSSDVQAPDLVVIQK